MMCLSYYQVTTFAVFRYITKKNRLLSWFSLFNVVFLQV